MNVNGKKEHWKMIMTQKQTSQHVSYLNLINLTFSVQYPTTCIHFRHYHSMEVFANYDILDYQGNKVADGHKASFCLEDVECMPGASKRYECVGYSDQGMSRNKARGGGGWWW